MTERPKFKIWNRWWTATIISASLTALVMFFENLGVSRDVGLLLSALGIIVTVVFGAAASTQSSVYSLGVSLERIELRLDKLDAIEARLASLDRIEALLRERLPRPS